MAKTTIKAAGDAFVLTSAAKFEDIQNIIKYGKNKALALVDPETKDTYFAVGISKNQASANKNGVEFTGANSGGFAEGTFSFPEKNMSKEKKEAHLTDKFAGVLGNLTLVEKQIVAELTKLTAELAQVKETIVVE